MHSLRQHAIRSILAKGLRVAGPACVAALLLGGGSPSAYAQCSTPEYEIVPHQALCTPNGTVLETVLFDLDGAGPESASLIACGSFTFAGDEQTYNVAAFNGTEWRALSTGFNRQVSCLAVYNNELYAGGTFTTRGPGGVATEINRVARWDGAEWQPLGVGVDATNTITPEVIAMQAFNGRLYVGGRFNRAGGANVNNLASWDGSLWRPVGTGDGGAGGVGGEIHDLAVFDSALIVAGAFTTINGSTSLGNALARFDGTNWSGYVVAPPPSGSADVRALATFSSASGASLYVGGLFSGVGGVTSENIARLNKPFAMAATWVTMGAGLDGRVENLVVQSSGTTVTNVYALSATFGATAGFTPGLYRFSSNTWNLFSEIGSPLGFYNGALIARSNTGILQRIGSDWLGFGPGLNEELSAIVEHNGELIAFGEFSASSSAVLNRVARLTNSGWQPVGGGLSPTVANVKSPVSFGGSLYVLTAPQASINYSVQRFNGTSWSTLPTSAPAERLRVIGADLYATTTRVEKWNGTSFATLGTGLPGNVVFDVVLYNGALHAILETSIYKLTGSTWAPVYTPRSGYSFNHGYVWNNTLFVAVSKISDPGSIDVLSGSTFVPSLAGHRPTSFTEWNGKLTVVTNGFPRQFDGTSWTQLNTPMVTTGNLIVSSGDLVGVGTSTNGSQVSPVFTRLGCCRADFNNDGNRTIDDIFIFLNAWFAQDPRTDVDGANGVNIDDIFIFINLWFVGC
jgi:hypothetical protein